MNVRLKGSGCCSGSKAEAAAGVSLAKMSETSFRVLFCTDTGTCASRASLAGLAFLAFLPSPFITGEREKKKARGIAHMSRSGAMFRDRDSLCRQSGGKGRRREYLREKEILRRLITWS